MSDRYKGLSITLAPGINEEEGDEIVAAIRLIRGVIAVVPAVVEGGDHFIRSQVNYEWRQRLHRFLLDQKD